MLTQIHKEQRRGKATSSEFHKLMGIKGLGKTGDTYALEKAIEIVFGIDEDERPPNYDMSIGIEREPLAFDFFKEKIALEFGTVELSEFIALGNNQGGTPDGIVNGKYPLETKCPQSKKYFSILRLGKDAIDEDWLIQLNHQMLLLGVGKGYFNIFTMYNGMPYHHFYEIERDMEMTEKMAVRLAEWVTIRDEHVKVLQSKI
jgi:hypothetical protein